MTDINKMKIGVALCGKCGKGVPSHEAANHCGQQNDTCKHGVSSLAASGCYNCVLDRNADLTAENEKLQHVVDGVVSAYPQLESIISKYLEERNG